MGDLVGEGEALALHGMGGADDDDRRGHRGQVEAGAAVGQRGEHHGQAERLLSHPHRTRQRLLRCQAQLAPQRLRTRQALRHLRPLLACVTLLARRGAPGRMPYPRHAPQFTRWRGRVITRGCLHHRRVRG